MTEGQDQAGVRVPPPLVFLGFLLLGLLIGGLTQRIGFGLPQPLRLIAAAVVFAGGAGLIVTALGRFHKAGTAPEPWRASTTIVDTGVYARTRNPMYLGMALVQIGFSLLLDSLWGAIMVIPAVLIIGTQVIAREERYLLAKFGEPYRDYQRRVRRWL